MDRRNSHLRDRRRRKSGTPVDDPDLDLDGLDHRARRDDNGRYCPFDDPPPEVPRRHLTMDSLTAFGLFAVTAMLVCYAFEDRSRWFILAFAGACALGSLYGFLQGA
jgi:hypothetical protein